jgi:alkylhydroperoxidase family enzyme
MGANIESLFTARPSRWREQLTKRSTRRPFDPDRIGLSSKERQIFHFVMKVNGDPHSITEEDIVALRAIGTTDSEIVEAIETLNTGNNTNVFCDALKIGADPFLIYPVEGHAMVASTPSSEEA